MSWEGFGMGRGKGFCWEEWEEGKRERRGGGGETGTSPFSLIFSSSWVSVRQECQ